MPRDRNRAAWFGPRLRALREAAGLTQTELGKRAGVVGSQINKLELGVNQPTLATAVALAAGLGVELTAFLPDGRGAPSKAPAVAQDGPGGKGQADGPAGGGKGQGKPGNGRDKAKGGKDRA